MRKLLVVLTMAALTLLGWQIYESATLAPRPSRTRETSSSTAESITDLQAADRRSKRTQPRAETTLEVDTKSNYSHIRIYRSDNTRTLAFVRDSGEEVVESMLNLDRPYELLVDYTRFMFQSYLLRPKPEKVLIVGLGGGSMIQFLKHYDPSVKVDVLEIDPVIVDIADKYFGTRSGGKVNVITTDAFVYLKDTDERYDVIYMDAFLKPSDDTDKTGVPLKLKTIRFYKQIQEKLKPDGMVAFNINPHPEIDEDIKNIREAFTHAYVFKLPNLGGKVVLGSTSAKQIPVQALNAEAARLDRRMRATFSFREMMRAFDPER